MIDCEEYKIEVIHTPGHVSNHLCYLVHDASTLITGDHIMNGSTVVIAPPDGNMKQYLSSLKLLKDYAFDYIAPGHGDYLEDPVAVVDWIINHRLQRESKVHECLKKYLHVMSMIWSSLFMMTLTQNYIRLHCGASQHI